MSIESTMRPPRTIEELSKQYEQLNGKKIQTETNLKNSQEQLDRLKLKAKEKYGTDDLGELTKILEEMKRKNEEDRAAYQASLDRIEAELEGIEEKFNSAETTNG